MDTVDTKIKARNTFNAMFVDTVDTGVCGSYTTLYRVLWGVKTLYKVAFCPCQEGRLFVFEKPSVFCIFLSDLSKTFRILDEPPNLDCQHFWYNSSHIEGYLYLKSLPSSVFFSLIWVEHFKYWMNWIIDTFNTNSSSIEGYLYLKSLPSSVFFSLIWFNTRLILY